MGVCSLFVAAGIVENGKSGRPRFSLNDWLVHLYSRPLVDASGLKVELRQQARQKVRVNMQLQKTREAHQHTKDRRRHRDDE
jgi:hypothetical protein